MSNQGVIFTKAQSAEVNMFASVGYRGYGLTYRATYNILYGECATREPECESQKNFRIDTIFYSGLSHLYGTPP